MAKEYKPGDTVQSSGIYLVTHETKHALQHEVTCVKGKTFPVCKGCEQPCFRLVHQAPLISNQEHFRIW